MSDSIDILKTAKDPEILKEINALADKVKQNQSSAKEDDTTAFDKRRKNIFMGLFLILCVLSYISFNYATYLFGFALGLLVTTFSLLAYEWLDEIYFKPYTIGKLGEDAKAIAIFFFALIYLFISSLEFGDRWIGGQSNTSIEENRIEVPAQQPEYPTADTTAPPVRIELRGGNGEPTYK